MSAECIIDQYHIMEVVKEAKVCGVDGRYAVVVVRCTECGAIAEADIYSEDLNWKKSNGNT